MAWSERLQLDGCDAYHACMHACMLEVLEQESVCAAPQPATCTRAASAEPADGRGCTHARSPLPPPPPGAASCARPACPCTSRHHTLPPLILLPHPLTHDHERLKSALHTIQWRSTHILSLSHSHSTHTCAHKHTHHPPAPSSSFLPAPTHLHPHPTPPTAASLCIGHAGCCWQVLEAVGGYPHVKRALVGWLWHGGWSYLRRFKAARDHAKVTLRVA